MKKRIIELVVAKEVITKAAEDVRYVTKHDEEGNASVEIQTDGRRFTEISRQRLGQTVTIQVREIDPAPAEEELTMEGEPPLGGEAPQRTRTSRAMHRLRA